MQNNVWLINITKILNFDFYNYKQNKNLFFIFKSQLRKTLWLNSDLSIKMRHKKDRLSFYSSYIKVINHNKNMTSLYDFLIWLPYMTLKINLYYNGKLFWEIYCSIF